MKNEKEEFEKIKIIKRRGPPQPSKKHENQNFLLAEGRVTKFCPTAQPRRLQLFPWPAAKEKVASILSVLLDSHYLAF